MENNLKFPKDFFWGAATSSHQIEGGNLNDWSEWEKEKAKRLASEAKNYWQKWQQEKFPEMFEPENYISGKACDHYNRFREDFDIAKSLGHNAHRFSIEWSRVEPKEGEFNEKEIEHYREVILALREREIEPFVTLWHWTLPLWIRDMGGWENKKTIEYFLRYAEKIIDEFKKDIKFWIPINEPTVYTGMSYIIGHFPPQVKSLRRANKVLKNLIKAYKKTYVLIHKKYGSKVMVGNANNLHFYAPFRKWSIFDIIAAKILNYLNKKPVKQIKNYQDFIGFNYYFRDTVKFVLWGGKYGAIDAKNSNEWISDMGWDIYPEGMYHILKYLKKYNKPIFITENGIADTEDKSREKFIKEHLFWVKKAIEEGADIRGYLHWSLVDNFEWDKGFWPRFGLIEIDYKTLERKTRPSAYFYRDIILNSKKI